MSRSCGRSSAGASSCPVQCCSRTLYPSMLWVHMRGKIDTQKGGAAWDHFPRGFAHQREGPQSRDSGCTAQDRTEHGPLTDAHPDTCPAPLFALRQGGPSHLFSCMVHSMAYTDAVNGIHSLLVSDRLAPSCPTRPEPLGWVRERE